MWALRHPDAARCETRYNISAVPRCPAVWSDAIPLRLAGATV